MGDRSQRRRGGPGDRAADRQRQEVLSIPGRTVHHASGSYRGDGKTDAKDAFVIADQARMRRYCRRLMQVLYVSAMVAPCSCPVSRAFYERKRAEGKAHKQAIIALARRRLNVLWAPIRDGRAFELISPQTPLALG